MPNDTSLATQAELTDIRLRVLNNERVSAGEFRVLLDTIRNDRRSAAEASAAAKREAKRATATPKTKTAHFDLDSLFGPR